MPAGRPRKWSSDADRHAYRRIEEREQATEVRAIVALARRSFSLHARSDDPDSQVLRALRGHLEEHPF